MERKLIIYVCMMSSYSHQKIYPIKMKSEPYKIKKKLNLMN